MMAISEIRVPRRDLPRYWPPRRFPAYRYVPGLHPHPTRDAKGHSYANDDADPPIVWQPRDWRRLEPWLWGVDLFNRFYFWEAHEAWEILWRTTRRDGIPALMLQALIQIAAAMLKTHMRAPAAARRLSAAGIEKLNTIAGETPSLMGLDVALTAHEMQLYFRPLAIDVLPALDANVPTLRLAAGQTPGECRS